MRCYRLAGSVHYFISGDMIWTFEVSYREETVNPSLFYRDHSDHESDWVRSDHRTGSE